MPLINIFFWVILVLLILLSFQLVYSFSRAENEIMRQAVQKGTCNRHSARRHNNHLRNEMHPSTVEFMTVGQGGCISNQSAVSFYLPSFQPDKSNEQTRPAAVSDCQPCA